MVNSKMTSYEEITVKIPIVRNEDFKRITNSQLRRQESFRRLSPEGKKVNYLDKEFIVRPNVFWPHVDSLVMVNNYSIAHGETVLDVCTGSGVLAIMSAYRGAGKVVGVDINPAAVLCARENIILHNYKDKIDIRESDLFEKIDSDESFDVITGNLPFRLKEAKDLVESTMWDTDFNLHKRFFQEVSNYLAEKGRIYLCHANYPSLRKLLKLGEAAGFSSKLIGTNEVDNYLPTIFLAFEFWRHSND